MRLNNLYFGIFNCRGKVQEEGAGKWGEAGLKRKKGKRGLKKLL